LGRSIGIGVRRRETMMSFGSSGAAAFRADRAPRGGLRQGAQDAQHHEGAGCGGG
jgi:hypothetical protein